MFLNQTLEFANNQYNDFYVKNIKHQLTLTIMIGNLFLIVAGLRHYLARENTNSVLIISGSCKKTKKINVVDQQV